MYKLFKCSIQSCKFFFKDGTVAYFTEGRFATNNEKQIAELEEEIKLGHPHIYVDDKEKETSSVMLDPMSALKERLRKEIMAEMETKPDMGTSDTSAGEGTGVGNSSTMQALSKIQVGSKSK